MSDPSFPAPATVPTPMLNCPSCGAPLRRKSSGLVNGKKKTKPRLYCSPKCRHRAARLRAWERQFRRERTDHRERDESRGKYSIFSRTCWPVDLLGGQRLADRARLDAATVAKIVRAEIGELQR